MNDVALRYGQALFLIADEKHLIDQYQDEMKQWEEIFYENEEFLNILKSSFYSQEKRKEVLKKTLKGINEDILNFFNVLIDNNRFNLIFDIFIAFNSLCNDSKGIVEGLLFSPFPLSKAQTEAIQKKISSLEKREVYLRNVIDKSLIGGVKIQINDHIYDDSIKHHIDELKTNLMK